MGERFPGIAHQAAGAGVIFIIHHQAPANGESRPFQNGSMGIENDVRNVCVVQQCLQPGKSHQVIRLQKLSHSQIPSA